MGSKMFPHLERKNGGVLAEKGTMQLRQNAIQDVVRTSDFVTESHGTFSGYEEITRPEL